MRVGWIVLFLDCGEQVPVWSLFAEALPYGRIIELGQQDSDEGDAGPVILGAVWAEIADVVALIKPAAGRTLVEEGGHRRRRR